MPVFALSEALVFPPPHLANRQGLLAIGGDLRPARILLAYEKGIFPWYNAGEPIQWWSPNPRFVLWPADLYVSKSMKQVLRRHTFTLTLDRAFRAVITGCQQSPREGQDGTWITPEMLEAYCTLHEMGYAHSAEAWIGDELVGGLYGISLGSCFFGESMFARTSNASKAAFIHLVQHLTLAGFTLVDCQVYTDHLASLGARPLPRPEFLQALAAGLQAPTRRGNWGEGVYGSSV